MISTVLPSRPSPSGADILHDLPNFDVEYFDCHHRYHFLEAYLLPMKLAWQADNGGG